MAEAVHPASVSYANLNAKKFRNSHFFKKWASKRGFFEKKRFKVLELLKIMLYNTKDNKIERYKNELILT